MGRAHRRKMEQPVGARSADVNVDVRAETSGEAVVRSSRSCVVPL